MIGTDSASFVLRPNIIVPKHSSLTLTPVLPSCGIAPGPRSCWLYFLIVPVIRHGRRLIARVSKIEFAGPATGAIRYGIGVHASSVMGVR